MSSIAYITGNVVAKPEIRMTQSGIKVATYSVASSRKNPKVEGEFLTDYYNVVAWQDLADDCENCLDKGTRVMVVGRFQTRDYNDKDGKKVYRTELMQNELWLAPTKPTAVEAETGTPTSLFDDDLPF